MWFIGVEVEQETSAPPPKKNPGSTPGIIPEIATKQYHYKSISLFKMVIDCIDWLLSLITAPLCNENNILFNL